MLDLPMPTEAKLLAGLAASYTTWKWMDGKYCLQHDAGVIQRLAPLVLEALQIMKTPGFTVVDLWARTLTKVKGNKTALIRAETGETMTFKQLDELSNRVAQWAIANPVLKAGECVAMVMENDPMYVVTWLGLAKAGLRAALINSNVKGKPLVHSIKVADASAVIYSTGPCADNVADVHEGLREAGIQVFACCRLDEPQEAVADSLARIPGAVDFRAAIAAAPDAPAPPARRAHQQDASHTFGYIYTSGTTGLPKACKISLLKLLTYSTAMPTYSVTGDDIIYGSGMPLYHTAANLGVMGMMRHGSTYIVRKKFSASNHWKECAKYKATVMQYIGELCRYLLAAPANPTEKEHCLRIAVGNGLRPDIWNEFQRRNNIPEIGEFYGATEGNAFLFNHCRNYQGQGAVGKAGPLLRMIRPFHILKFDVEEEEPIRTKEGRCVEVGDNEPGELISPIREFTTAGGKKAADFDGYTSKEATEKKILRNVFKEGDSYFRTGDLVKKIGPYTYFVDRIGDTFRWKGENVSTMEVSEVLSTYPGVLEASVYGVEVPKKDGRACMVALRLHDGASLDPKKFAVFCAANLPTYSVPLFIRFLKGMDSTGTFKHMKLQYKKDGFDPSKCPDKMWYYNPRDVVYAPLDSAAFAHLCSGQAKL